MEKHKHERSTFSGKIGFVLSAAGASVGLGKYMEIPLSGGKVRRWNFSTDLYHSGIDLWIFYDHGRDSSGTYDKEKSGRCVWNFW